MKLVAKSIPHHPEILHKMELGAETIEIQLLKDFINCDVNLDHVYECIITAACDVSIVHMPLDTFYELNLEFLTYPLYQKTFLNCCKLSQRLARAYNHPVILVVHVGITFKYMQLMPGIFDSLQALMNQVVEDYPDIEIAFENIIPVSYKKGVGFHGCNGFLYDNVDFANYFNKTCKRKAFGTVLDTCHVLTVQEMLSDGFSKYLEIENITMEEYFRRNKDVIKLIHLADLENIGLEPYEHGCAFQDENKLREILSYYYKYEYDCLVTLEINEIDYLNCVNFCNNKKMIEKIVDEFEKNVL